PRRGGDRQRPLLHCARHRGRCGTGGRPGPDPDGPGVTPSRGLRLLLRGLLGSILAATVVFMLAPSVVVVLLSLSNDSFMRLPPTSWGFRQYATLFGTPDWLEPSIRSLTLAAWTAVVAVPLGLAAVLGVYRTEAPGRSLVRFLGLAPLLIPSIAYA